MAFHLAAFFESIGNTADTDVNALSDQILAITNNHFILNQEMRLIAAMAMSATLSRAKLASPRMRQIANPFIRPITAAVKPASNPNIMILDHNPITIPANEEIQLLATSGVAMTENFTALIWLQDRYEVPPRGDVTALRFTSTTAVVANTWTDLTLTWADTLPSGRYGLVLSECQSAQAQAHRWIIPNQFWRPGFPSFTNLSDRLPYAMSKGQFGLMGVFRSNDLPRLQVLCNSTDNSHEGYAHVVPLGPI